VAHPGDHGSLSPPLHRDALGPGDRAAADGGGMVGHRTGQTSGEGGMTGVESQERHHRPEEVLDILGLDLLSAACVGRLPPNEALGGPLCFEFGTDAADGAHTPREKTLRPFLSWTTQCSPAAFTRRVRRASPGGSRIQPGGAVRTRPSAARTVFGVGPGVKTLLLMLPSPPCVWVRRFAHGLTACQE
jgi:hypothetical protein